MPSYWAINARARAGGAFVIPSRRGVSIREGDSLVFYSGEGNQSAFRQAARVLGVVEVGARESPEAMGISSQRFFQVKFDHVQDLDVEVTLETLKYSLQRVRRFDKPHAHFRRTYTRISGFDFETIRTGRIFWARTVFGTILNELPLEVQRVLQSELLSARAISPSGELDCEIGLAVLKDFIDSRYLKVARLFSGIDSLLGDLARVGIRRLIPEELSFRDEGDDAGDSILLQVRLFEEFLTELSPQNHESLWESIQRLVSAAEGGQAVFTKEFRRAQWPLMKKSA